MPLTRRRAFVKEAALFGLLVGEDCGGGEGMSNGDFFVGGDVGRSWVEIRSGAGATEGAARGGAGMELLDGVPCLLTMGDGLSMLLKDSRD